ncbi:MAG: LAGLIDADG family homing endonuclease [Nanoarchaeota archaeon]
MRLINIRLKTLNLERNNIYVKLKQEFLLNFLKEVSKEEKPYRNRKFCEFLGVGFNGKIKASPTMIAWIKFNRAIPLSKLARITTEKNWLDVENNVIHLQQSMGGEKVFINFPLKLDERVGSIIGHILGDGSIDKKYQQVFYSNSNPDLLKEFRNNMKRIFGIEPRIWMQRTANFYGKTRWEKRLDTINELETGKNCGLFYPTISGRILNSIFGNFAIGKEKNITNNIKNGSQSFKIGLIRAFYDDEGTVGEKNLRLFQDRKEVLENFRKFLIELGIYPGEVKTYVKHDKDRYYFDIHRKSNLIKFRDKVGFTSSKKMEKLKCISLIKNLKNSK